MLQLREKTAIFRGNSSIMRETGNMKYPYIFPETAPDTCFEFFEPALG